MLDTLFISLHLLGLLVYGGALLSSTVRLLRARSQPLAKAQPSVAAYQRLGPAMGLAMGALIFGGLARYYQLQGGFSWPVDTLAQQLTAAKHGLFLVLWFSSFHLEIWTIEPLRKLTGDGGVVSDEAAWRATVQKASVQASFNSLVFLVLGGLSLAARMS